MAGDSIHTGDISGTGIAVGPHARASVTTQAAGGQQLAALVSQLREELAKAELPPKAKEVLLAGPVQQIEAGATQGDSGGNVKHGLERFNDQLEVLGVTAKGVEGVVGTLSKIAQVAGVTWHTLPFLAGLL